MASSFLFKMEKKMTWEEFFEIVALEANKGNTLKEIIPHKVYQSLHSLEQNWSYKWNEKLLKFQIDPNSENTQLLELPPDLKSIITCKVSSSDFSECSRELSMLDPSDFEFGDNSEPDGYWLQGDSYLWFSAGVQPGMSGALWYNAFTLREDMIGDNTSPMLKHGYQALLGLTMQNLAAYCREPQWTEQYGTLAEIGIKTLHIADEELRRLTSTISFGGISDE